MPGSDLIVLIEADLEQKPGLKYKPGFKSWCNWFMYCVYTQSLGLTCWFVDVLIQFWPRIEARINYKLGSDFIVQIEVAAST